MWRVSIIKLRRRRIADPFIYRETKHQSNNHNNSSLLNSHSIERESRLPFLSTHLSFCDVMYSFCFWIIICIVRWCTSTRVCSVAREHTNINWIQWHVTEQQCNKISSSIHEHNATVAYFPLTVCVSFFIFFYSFMNTKRCEAVQVKIKFTNEKKKSV